MELDHLIYIKKLLNRGISSGIDFIFLYFLILII